MKRNNYYDKIKSSSLLNNVDLNKIKVSTFLWNVENKFLSYLHNIQYKDYLQLQKSIFITYEETIWQLPPWYKYLNSSNCLHFQCGNQNTYPMKDIHMNLLFHLVHLQRIRLVEEPKTRENISEELVRFIGFMTNISIYDTFCSTFLQNISELFL